MTTDTTIVFTAPDGTMVAVKAIDTGTADGKGHQIYRLGVDSAVTIDPGLITIGAVTVKDNAAATEASVKLVTLAAETDNALVVQAPVLGKISDAADKAGGASSLNAKIRGLIQLIAAGIPAALGQTTMAASLPVTVASDQTAIPVSLASDIELGSVKLLDAGGTNEAKIAPSASIAEANNLIGVQAPVLGTTSGAKVITDASGTIQQYLRGLVYLLLHGLPASLGQLTMAASTSVTIASDQSAVPVSLAKIAANTAIAIGDDALSTHDAQIGQVGDLFADGTVIGLLSDIASQNHPNLGVGGERVSTSTPHTTPVKVTDEPPAGKTIHLHEIMLSTANTTWVTLYEETTGKVLAEVYLDNYGAAGHPLSQNVPLSAPDQALMMSALADVKITCTTIWDVV